MGETPFEECFVKRKLTVWLLIFALIVMGAVAYDVYVPKSGGLKIYGSVDMRTVRLAFEEAGRLEILALQEGAKVQAGEPIAQLEARRYEIALESARAAQEVAARELRLLQAGARIQEIDAARATLEAAKAARSLSERTCMRERRLGEATSPLRVDQACSQARVDAAKAVAAEKNLDLLLAGTRLEQIQVAQANLELARQRTRDAARALENCVLRSPVDGFVRSRLKEPGDMVSAQTPVYEIAMMSPLWVRAWIDEVNLGKISPGLKVSVSVDSYPDRRFEGTVGFVSSVAEFTPKTVQTEDLRTALVYEVRITVNDPDSVMRLGMPVTVDLGK